MHFSFVLLSISLTLINADPTPPTWPNYFTYQWTMAHVYDDIQLPPYNTIPLVNTTIGRGRTYYDWSLPAMVEYYYDICIPIFEATSNNFTCNFLNVNGVAYIVVTDPRATGRPPCCIFQKPWSPPAPNFLQTAAGVKYNGTGVLYTRPVYWWVLDDPEDPAGPFGYSFFEDTCRSSSTNMNCTPSQFFFRATTGFASQFFDDYKVEKPDPSVFAIPDSCNTAQECDV
ncbi:unnamed protein product [Rotaria magnacalcarata]|uniref:Uncharacterized protein n=1 Tax=Rotaria magnacalcarata TaxID=392030 RepID=A0A815XUM2_9BILA|nr:unnamed protein product [Rotaria magnacalcarata]CAF1561798.1 unnamed protein product [Rotaria magnacalcarata]CAF4984348.1 unnamed protein product [Rotaria magnacalcarata]CAF5195982.1 unnamed protein product [Rotaria magnacalcarata]